MRRRSPQQRLSLTMILCTLWAVALLLLLSSSTTVDAFTTPGFARRSLKIHQHQQREQPLFRPRPLFSKLPDVSGMSVSDMRKELESYGISSKSFLEKKELVAAIEKARAEGKTAKSKSDDSDKSNTSNGAKDGSSKSREERIQEEVEKASKKKATELRKELEAMGVSTKSFFEKSEFVRAYAEAVVDGVEKKKAAAGSAGGSGGGWDDDDYDSSYRDVVMQKFDPRSLGPSTIIDIVLSR